MSDKIQRWESRPEAMLLTGVGVWVKYDAHLADKKAALEAQAEENRGKLAHEEEQWANALNLARLKHTAKLATKNAEHDASDRLLASLLDEKDAELAAKDEELNNLNACLRTAISQRDVWQRLHSEDLAQLAALRGEREPALMHYKNARLIGEPCMIHRDFQRPLYRLCNIANSCGVDLWVTHSMRPLGQKLVDAIVEQAARSNHHAGSAVDLNPVYESVWYTSKMMEDLGGENFHRLPVPVRSFLNAVIADPDLRWGGSFGINKDRVHFDSDLARCDPAEWQRRTTQLAEEMA